MRFLPITKYVLMLMVAVAGLFAVSTGAEAQATRTWVSGVGDDVNPCSRTAPCKTFAGAISKTARNGEINCLDPAGYGAVTITKSITLDCRATLGSVLNAGTNGIIVNFDAFDPALDTRKTVRLRYLSLNGADTGINGVRIIGAAASAGSEVFVQNVTIDGNFSGTARGISDERTGGGELSISDTSIANTGGSGIVILAGTGAGRLDAAIDHVRVQNSNFGVAVANNARVMISNSVFSGNTGAGIEAEGTPSAVEVNVVSSVISSNGQGVQNATGPVTIRLADTDIAFNTLAFSGATQSFGNNRVSGNGSVGTVPTFIGPDAPAKGQQ